MALFPPDLIADIVFPATCKNLSKLELPEKGAFGKKILGTNKMKA